MAVLSTEDESFFANLLLPQSDRPRDALCTDDFVEDPSDDVNMSCSLKGIHFTTITAPRPTNARPKHFREMMACKNKCISNRLAQSVKKIIDANIRGTLPVGARFILDSRVVFLNKERYKNAANTFG